MNKSSISIAAAVAALVCAWSGITPPASAQSPFVTPAQSAIPTLDQRRAERTERRDKAQKMWDAWRAKRGSHEELAQIASQMGLRPTKENADSVIGLMRDKATTNRDKAMLSRMAGDLYRDLGEQGDLQTQEQVRAFLADVVKTEKEPEFQRAAAFTYSRLGWFPDSMHLFQRSRFVWGDKDYYNELAHALVSAPQGEQLKILKALEAGDTAGGYNAFAKEILASHLKHEGNVKRLHPEVARGALAMFKKQEPKFPSDPVVMGVSLLDGYADWAGAVVTLTTQASGEPPRLVLARMVDVKDDPRKLIAVLMDGKLAALMNTAIDRKSMVEIEAAITSFGEKYKTNPNVQDFVGEAKRGLVIAKG